MRQEDRSSLNVSCERSCYSVAFNSAQCGLRMMNPVQAYIWYVLIFTAGCYSNIFSRTIQYACMYILHICMYIYCTYIRTHILEYLKTVLGTSCALRKMSGNKLLLKLDADKFLKTRYSTRQEDVRSEEHL